MRVVFALGRCFGFNVIISIRNFTATSLNFAVIVSLNGRLMICLWPERQKKMITDGKNKEHNTKIHWKNLPTAVRWLPKNFIYVVHPVVFINVKMAMSWHFINISATMSKKFIGSRTILGSTFCCFNSTSRKENSLPFAVYRNSPTYTWWTRLNYVQRDI